MLNEGTYKETFIREHGETAYAEKLAQNAKWRAVHPEKMAEYKEARGRNSKSREDVVYFICDVHIGASTVNIDFIKELAKRYWSKNPIVIMGDLADLGLDRGMNWDNKYGPQEQMDLVEEIFPQLDVRAFCTANHENRIYERVGLTPYIKMFGMKPSTNITINGRDIFFSHGKSAAENYFLEFQKITKWQDADVIALGHSHDLATIAFLRGKKIQHFVRTGSFLGRPKYVTDSAFAPKISGWAEYHTIENIIRLKGITEEGEVFNL